MISKRAPDARHHVVNEQDKKNASHGVHAVVMVRVQRRPGNPDDVKRGEGLVDPRPTHQNDHRPGNMKRRESAVLHGRLGVNVMKDIPAHHRVQAFKPGLVGRDADKMAIFLIKHCRVGEPWRCCREEELDEKSGEVDPAGAPQERIHTVSPPWTEGQVEEEENGQGKVNQVRDGREEVENWVCVLGEDLVW